MRGEREARPPDDVQSLDVVECPAEQGRLGDRSRIARTCWKTATQSARSIAEGSTAAARLDGMYVASMHVAINAMPTSA